MKTDRVPGNVQLLADLVIGEPFQPGKPEDLLLLRRQLLDALLH